MDKKILLKTGFILLILALGVCGEKYIDGSYVYAVQVGGPGFIWRQIDLTYPSDNISYYPSIFDTIYGSSRLLRPTLLHVFGQSTGNYNANYRYNKTNNQTENFFIDDDNGRGMAVDGNELFMSNLGEIRKFNVDDVTNIWNVSVPGCLDSASPITYDTITLDEESVYVGCTEYTNGFVRINRSTGNIEDYQNLTGVQDVYDYDIDRSYIYTIYEESVTGLVYLSLVDKDDVGLILDTEPIYQYMGDFTDAYTELNIIGNYVYITRLNVSNSVLDVYKFNKLLNLVKNVSIGSDITGLHEVDTDNDNLYIAAQGTTDQDGGLFVVNANLELEQHIKDDFIIGVGRSSYKGTAETGQGIYNLDVTAKVNGNYVGATEVLCTLYETEIENENIVGIEFTNSSGKLQFKNLIAGYYISVCEIDTSAYENVLINPISKGIELDADKTIYYFFGTTDNPQIRADLTLTAVNEISYNPIEEVYIQVYNSTYDQSYAGLTDINGEITFNPRKCRLCFNASHINYEYYEDCINVNTADYGETITLTPSYGYNSSECYVDGLIYENGLLRDSVIDGACWRGDDVLTISGKQVKDGAFNITGLPDGYTCVFFYFETVNGDESIELSEQPYLMSTVNNTYCNECKCSITSNVYTNPKFRIGLRHNGFDVLNDVSIQVYNETDYLFDMVYSVGYGETFESDQLVNGSYYQFRVISDTWINVNHTENSLDYNDSPIYIDLFKPDDVCTLKTTFQSDKLVDSENENLIYRILVSYENLDNGLKTVDTIEKSDKNFYEGFTTLKNLQCGLNYEITIDSDVFNGDNKEITVNAQLVSLDYPLKIGVVNYFGNKSFDDFVVLVKQSIFWVGLLVFATFILFFVAVFIKLWRGG